MPSFLSIGFSQGTKFENTKLSEAVQRAYLNSNTVFVLDAGDIASWNGSGQLWKDVSSSNVNFFLGSTSSVENPGDPAFSGAAGHVTSNEFWLTRGGGGQGQAQFQLAAAAPAELQDIHQLNAKFTLLAVVWFPSSPVFGSSGGSIIGNCGGNAPTSLGTGFKWELPYANPPSPQKITITNGGSTVLSVQASNTISTNSWHVIGLSYDSTSNTGFFYLDGSYDNTTGNNTFNASMTNPSAGNAAYTLQIMNQGGQNESLVTGGRLAGIILWSGQALTKNELDEIYTQIAPRWSGLPPAQFFPPLPSSNTNVTILNPSAEFTDQGFQTAGIANNWVQTIPNVHGGPIVFPVGHPTTPHNGALTFIGELFTGLSEAYQDITLPPDWFNAIDTGHAKCNVTYWQVGTGDPIGSSVDQIAVTIHFLDQNGSDLGNVSTGLLRAADANSTSGSWTQQSLAGNIASGARTLRLYQRHVHNQSGIFAYDQLLDDFSPITLSVV